jgi:hypothetical protein
MSKPMVTTLPLPWRMKSLERVRRIEIKSPAETPGFLLGCAPRKPSLSFGCAP